MACPTYLVVHVTRITPEQPGLLVDIRQRLLYYVNVARRRHPSKVIEEAVRYAESSGWSYRIAGKSAHAWGFIRCPGGCPQFAVWSTPRVPEHHAQAICRAVDRCPHSTGEAT